MFALNTLLSKARENILAARLCHQHEYYNATANRAYYACAQASVASLVQSNRLPHTLNHKAIQREFLNLYSSKLPELPTILSKLRTYRETADYKDINIIKRESLDCLTLANDFVSLLLQHLKRK